MVRRCAVATVFGFALVVNPALLFAGCGYHFGEAEAVAVLKDAGAHKAYRFSVDGSDYDATLDLRQATKPTPRLSYFPTWVPSAHACGDRTFVKSASACLDTTRVPVEGTLQIVRVNDPGSRMERTVLGDLVLEGTRISSASVELFTPSREVVRLTASDAKTFSIASLQLDDPTRQRRLEFTR